MIILINIDGPIADERTTYFSIAKEMFPEHVNALRFPERAITLKSMFSLEERIACDSTIRKQARFFGMLAPTPGAKEGLEKISAAGHEAVIFFEPSPLLDATSMIWLYSGWLKSHMGSKWGQHLRPVTDVTTMKGDILIDSRPEIEGSIRPQWRQLLFTASHNTFLSNRVRFTWDRCEEFFPQPVPAT